MTDKGRFPKVNRGYYFSNPQEDLGWYEGTFSNGRPFRVEYWYQLYTSYLTVFFSAIDMENATPQEFETLLQSEGVIDFDNERYLGSGFTGVNIHPNKDQDASNNEIWKITIIVGDDDGTYVHINFPLNKHVDEPDRLLYSKKTKTVFDAEYFLVLREDHPTPTLCRLYFINNTDKTIETLFENWLIARRAFGPQATIDQITEAFLSTQPNLIRHKNITAKSVLQLGTLFFTWEFDWPNDHHIALKSLGDEKHISFYIPRRHLGTEHMDNIPIMNRDGWVWFLKDS